MGAQFCSKDELWEAAKEEEMKIPWKEAQEELPVPEDQYQEIFWRRRLDGIGLDTVNSTLIQGELQILCLRIVTHVASTSMLIDVKSAEEAA